MDLYPIHIEFRLNFILFGILFVLYGGFELDWDV